MTILISAVAVNHRQPAASQCQPSVWECNFETLIPETGTGRRRVASRGEGGDKFVGNELSIANVVMRGSIYVMIRHNASIIEGQETFIGFYLRDTIKRLKVGQHLNFWIFCGLVQWRVGAINSGCGSEQRIQERPVPVAINNHNLPRIYSNSLNDPRIQNSKLWIGQKEGWSLR